MSIAKAIEIAFEQLPNNSDRVIRAECDDFVVHVHRKNLDAEPEPQAEHDWLNTMDGLPPAGTECMVLNPEFDNAQWEKCKILYMGNFICVYESESCKERVGNHDLYNVHKNRARAGD